MKITPHVKDRNPMYYACVGDIWKLNDGTHLLVDFVDPFLTGCTWTTGERKALKYSSLFAQYLQLKQAILVSRAEDHPFLLNTNEKGWTDDINRKITNDESLAFLNDRLKDIQ